MTPIMLCVIKLYSIMNASGSREIQDTHCELEFIFMYAFGRVTYC